MNEEELDRIDGLYIGDYGQEIYDKLISEVRRLNCRVDELNVLFADTVTENTQLLKMVAESRYYLIEERTKLLRVARAAAALKGVNFGELDNAILEMNAALEAAKDLLGEE